MRLFLLLGLALSVRVVSFGADVPSAVAALMNDEQELKGVLFSEVVLAATGKQLIPINATNMVDRDILAKIGQAMDEVLRKLNATNSATQSKRRINEVSALFEAAMKVELNAVEGFACDFPKTAVGAYQRSGYPDLRLVDRKSGRVLYIDPKLFERGGRMSSLRTFYFEPKRETNKILDDAHHLLVGIEHDGNANGHWHFTSWELVDLAKLRVQLKAEFQAGNRDLYRPEAVVAESRTNKVAR